MGVEITLVRHGETEGNVAGVWQGTGDSALTARGAEQVKRLGERLDRREFDLVLTSPLGRATATAAATRFAAESSPGWREMDLGAWEGLDRREVEARYPDELAAFKAGQDIAVGGTGETVTELVERSVAALRAVAERLDDGQKALVVSHGGPIMMATAAVLGVARRGPLHPIVNTALTRMVYEDGTFQVAAFNDAGHLNGHHAGFHGDSQVVLIRHGQTVSNLESRWQGRQPGALTPLGHEQAAHAASIFPAVRHLYSSPLARALETAAPIAGQLAVDVTPLDDLAEMYFGAWENMTSEEIEAAFPDEWRRFREGEDLPRGGDGETYAAAGARLAAAIENLTQRHPDQLVGAVTHGGVSRALVSHVLGIGFDVRHRLHLLHNTAMARVVLNDGRLVLGSYNVAPHH